MLSGFMCIVNGLMIFLSVLEIVKRQQQLLPVGIFSGSHELNRFSGFFSKQLSTLFQWEDRRQDCDNDNDSKDADDGCSDHFR